MSAFNVDASTKNVAPVTPRQQSGLTLLEVMVALLIFALTGTAVLKAAGEHLSSVGQIESYGSSVTSVTTFVAKPTAGN